MIHIEFNVKVTQSCATQFGKHIANDSESMATQMLFVVKLDLLSVRGSESLHKS